MDYKIAYYKLFNAITDAIECLVNAQRETEEMYISNELDKKQKNLGTENSNASVPK